MVNRGKEISCVLCAYQEEIRDPNLYSIKCDKCGEFELDTHSPAATIRKIAQDHLLSGFTREKWECDGIPFRLDDYNIEPILNQCPQTIREKADKFLTAIHRQTKHFGQEIPVNREIDYPLAYAHNAEELDALDEYLKELGFIKHPTYFDSLSHVTEEDLEVVILTGKGFEAIASRTLSPSITVFICSTCYDLLDLRAELTEFLESKGFIVRASDDPYHIDVEPTETSIDTCLRNVDSSDVIVCILDGRYGPVLPPNNEISAPHAEIRYAREIKRPIYIFGRDKALSDFDQLRKDENAKTLWVEKHDPEKRKRWLAFAKELQGLSLAQTQGHSNWIDTFQTSVRLKKLVLKRLSEFQRKKTPSESGKIK